MPCMAQGWQARHSCSTRTRPSGHVVRQLRWPQRTGQVRHEARCRRYKVRRQQAAADTAGEGHSEALHCKALPRGARPSRSRSRARRGAQLRKPACSARRATSPARTQIFFPIGQSQTSYNPQEQSYFATSSFQVRGCGSVPVCRDACSQLGV